MHACSAFWLEDWDQPYQLEELSGSLATCAKVVADVNTVVFDFSGTSCEYFGKAEDPATQPPLNPRFFDIKQQPFYTLFFVGGW